MASELGLVDPGLPWHTDRGRVVELGHALARTAGSLAKMALDVALLSQAEVAEVAEPAPGGSSTLPQKRNPVGSALVRACARGVAGQALVLTAALEQEQERAAGAWQSEWPALGEALRFTAGATAGMAAVLEGLAVDERRMRANLDAGGGLVMSEAVMMALAGKIGRQAAHDLVEKAVRRAATGLPFREALLADPHVEEHLGGSGVDAALDPARYLGAAEVLVKRALEEFETTRSADERDGRAASGPRHGGAP